MGGASASVCPPRGEAFAVYPVGTLRAYSPIYTRPVEFTGSRPRVAVVHTVAGDELPRVLVVPVPRLLTGVQRAAVGRGARANVLNAVGRGVGVGAAEAEHDGVGVGTDDLSVGVEHSLLLLLRDA